MNPDLTEEFLRMAVCPDPDAGVGKTFLLGEDRFGRPVRVTERRSEQLGNLSESTAAAIKATLTMGV